MTEETVMQRDEAYKKWCKDHKFHSSIWSRGMWEDAFSLGHELGAMVTGGTEQPMEFRVQDLPRWKPSSIDIAEVTEVTEGDTDDRSDRSDEIGDERR